MSVVDVLTLQRGHPWPLRIPVNSSANRMTVGHTSPHAPSAIERSSLPSTNWKAHIYVYKPILSGGDLSPLLFEQSGTDFQAPASEALAGAPALDETPAESLDVKTTPDVEIGSVRASKRS